MDVVSPESVGLNSQQLNRVGEHLRGRYVEQGKIPGSLALVARHGKVCYLDVAGQRDIERAEPMTTDTIFRIYSMTKPIIVTALMTLFEQGRFQLFDPVSKFLPAIDKMTVLSRNSAGEKTNLA
jgi:CubicO group peptidase (beta-lactamase class C family)